MGDEMDTMIPEREMKVRHGLGLPPFLGFGVALEPRFRLLLDQFTAFRVLTRASRVAVRAPA
jgi:hypothetical protein